MRPPQWMFLSVHILLVCLLALPFGDTVSCSLSMKYYSPRLSLIFHPPPPL